MAVSGRIPSDFQASFSRGSAEDFEHCCTPCFIEGQHVEAHGYCLDCQEYLCSNCFKFHKKTKATRNHQLLDKASMDKRPISAKPVEICTEECSIHRNEVIKYFCPKHEVIGCTDCMTMNHRTCKLDYIPDKCAGIGDSDEYREIMKELDQAMKEADSVLQKAAFKDKDIENSHDSVTEQILKKRKEINDHLDIIQKKIEADARIRKATSKQEVQKVISSCTNLSANIKKLQSSLQKSQLAKQNCKLFIDMKRAKSELQSGEIQQAEVSLAATGTQFTFNSSKDLEAILSVGSFGSLTTEQEVAAVASPRTIQTPVSTKRMKKIFSNLQHATDIKLNKNRFITGCVTLSSDRLVLADYGNSTLTVINTKKNVVVEEKKLETDPWDIAVLPVDKIAVTFPNNKQILIMTAAGELSTDHSISVNGNCNGIIYRQSCLYVLCTNPNSILTLDMRGNIKKTIKLTDQAAIGSPQYIVLSQDQSLFYVSDYGRDSIVSVTLEGKVSAIYRYKNLVSPTGMLVLDDGSLLVCCCKNHSIHHVSADLQQSRKVMDGLGIPRSICYSADRSKVYVGTRDNKLSVFSVIYTTSQTSR